MHYHLTRQEEILPEIAISMTQIDSAAKKGDFA